MKFAPLFKAIQADESQRTPSPLPLHREKMLSEKIDYAKFLTWFIENYPQSAKETRNNQQNEAFWNQFK